MSGRIEAVRNRIDLILLSWQHTDNWAVLVCTSRFWFNYRHIANTLAVYRSVGSPDTPLLLITPLCMHQLATSSGCEAPHPELVRMFTTIVIRCNSDLGKYMLRAYECLRK